MARDASGADALALQREQERRRRRAKQQHGHAAPPPPVARQPGAEGSTVAGSVSSGSLGGRSSSPDSTPAAPPPRAPARKRRPAPAPPPPSTGSNVNAKACDKREPAVVITEAGSQQVVSHHDGTTTTVTHSRTSSDSSGYHEASVLSDGPDTHPGDKTLSTREMPPPTSNSTLPRRSKLPPATGTTSAAPPKRGPTVASSMPLSRSVSNLATAAPGRVVHGEHSTSTSSLSSTGRGPRKKKAAPPPPPPPVAAAPAGARAASLDRSSTTPAALPAETRTSDPAGESRTLPRTAASAGKSDARRAASIEEEKEAFSPERRPSREVAAKHHQQQQRSSAELPAEKADLYAKLQRRLPSRGDSVTSTSSSGSDDAATTRRVPVDDKCASVPAPAVRPSRSRDRASAATRDCADGQSRPQPDVVAVQAPSQLPAPAPKGKDAAPPVPLPRKKVPGNADGVDAPALADGDLPHLAGAGDGGVTPPLPPPLSRTGSGSSLGIYGSTGSTFGAGSSLLAMSSETSSAGTGCAAEDADDGLLGVEESLFDREAAVPEEEFVDLEDGEERVGGRLGRWPNSENLHVLLGRGSVSSKHSSTAPDEDDLAVDEGIGNDDAAEEVARAFASATAELEAAILAEDLAAAAVENSTAAYYNIDPPCPTSLASADIPTRLPLSPDAPAAASDSEEWHYEIPAPPSAFRDSTETPPPTPWSFAEGEVHTKANPLYDSGEFVKEVSDSPREMTATVEERNSVRTQGGGTETTTTTTMTMMTTTTTTIEEEEVAERQRALTGAERQLRGVLDAKARLLLPQPQLIQGPAADVGVVLKDAENEPSEGSPLNVPEDSSVSQENHSHSLLNHHHAGLLHRHAPSEDRHDRHHHHLHHSEHHHGGHSTNVGMPAYLTETIDTLEGFEDLIAVGSGSRPPEECQNVENRSTGGAELQVAEEVRRSSVDGERPVVVAEVVKSSESSATLETSSVNAEVAKEVRTNSASTVEPPTVLKESPESSGDPSVESGEAFPWRRHSGEVTVDERKEEVTRAESDRQQRAQRRRTVEVAGPLVNFTITTYRREIDPDKIFAEAEDTPPRHISGVTAPAAAVAAAGVGERRPSAVSRSNSVGGSASSRNSSAACSRRGSQAEQQPGRPHSQVVKRSVSSVYAALQGVAAQEAARLSGAVESTSKENSSSSQLQSLQVLRSILPQLKSAPDQQTSSSSSSSERLSVTTDTSEVTPQSESLSRNVRKTTEETRVPEVVAKTQPQPYRPPAVSFASWGERPRSRAVSLKVDSDYRVGGAHTKAQQTSQEPQPVETAAATDISKPATLNGAAPEKQPELATTVAAGQNAPVRSGEPPQPATTKVEPTVIRISTATAEPRIRAVQLKPHAPPSGVQTQRSDPVTTRRDGAALTMRIISHTTAAPFVRQGATSVTVNGDDRVVPVVRAVELKKSVLQQKQQADENGRVDSAGEEERFVGVSSLAKRFSFLGDNTVVQRRNSGSGRVARRPVSELVTASDAALASAEPGSPVHRAGSFASLVSASRASQLGRSDSSDDSVIGHSAGVLPQNGHGSPTVKQGPVTVSAAPKGFPLPVVKGFRVPGGGAPEPRKGITLVTRPKAGAAAASSLSAQPSVPNPHEQLMAAIRGFGGTGSLRNQAQKIAECES